MTNIGETIDVELPLTWHIAFKILEIGGIFLFVLIIIVSVRNIFFSDNPLKPPDIKTVENLLFCFFIMFY